uniref:Uncharacterized protein n=1 Tax=Amphimedon queenslandica TaxID=400682 RepID=A0A1X7VAQ3_AMPQE
IDLLRTAGNGPVSVSKIFIDQLEGELSPCNEYQDPFESDRPLQRTETVSSYDSSANCYQTVTDGTRELGIRRERERRRNDLCNSDDSCGSSKDGIDHSSIITSTVELTEHDRMILEFRTKAELNETRSEQDQLKKQAMQLQEKLFKKDEKIKNLEDEVDKRKETIHKINSPNFDYALKNGNLCVRVVIESLQKSLKSLDGEVEVHKLKLKESNSELDLQKE